MRWNNTLNSCIATFLWLFKTYFGNYCLFRRLFNFFCVDTLILRGVGNLLTFRCHDGHFLYRRIFLCFRDLLLFILNRWSRSLFKRILHSIWKTFRRFRLLMFKFMSRLWLLQQANLWVWLCPLVLTFLGLVF